MDNIVKPFLRWAGGKRWLAKKLAPIIKNRLGDENTYIEPFLGSASMFFAVDPPNALLTDLNKELITAYKQVAKQHDMIKLKLNSFSASKTQYYIMRKTIPNSSFDRAVRLIYLNRNCFGGLYRENKSGEFNVPFGGGTRNHMILCRNGMLEKASNLLSKDGIVLASCDFAKSMGQAQKGDVIYCDPTYRPVTRKHFDRYGKIIFDWTDQERLAKESALAFQKGSLVIISNAYCDNIKSLYPDSIVIKITRKTGFGIESKDLNEFLFILDPQQNVSDWIGIGEKVR